MKTRLNSLFLGAYWLARRESIHDCTDRLFNFFHEFAACDASVSQWYELANSNGKSLEKPARVDSRDWIVRKLDSARHSFDDLGFSFGLWNGQDERKSVSLSITCGLYYEGLINCVTLQLPQDLGGLTEARRMRRVLAAMAMAWEPDWAGVMSDEAMHRRKFDARKPFVDWMLYISDKWLPEVPAFDPPASADRAASGTIIIVQEEPPDPHDPLHLENIRRVRARLRRRMTISA